MKTDNINRLIAHVEGLEEQIPDWRPNHCLSGMILKMQGRETFGETTTQVISDFTGASVEDANRLSYRLDQESMENFPLEKQKETIIHALTTLRDNGKAVWLW